ncbi:MAG: PIG-L family deacetylase, partial [Deltaproteobacteria bacterium]|nr:PIG-L family deacetylase [Deltaproteobacteria bacterium]
QQGTNVHLIFATSGKAGRVNSSATDTEKITSEQESLKQESQKASTLLQVASTTFLDFPDNRLDTISRMDISLAIKSLLTNIQPNIVFTHHHGDYNWDHNIISEASMMACRPNLGEQFPQTILGYEVLSSTERAFQTPQQMFCPTVFVDIAATLEIKKQAMRCYLSELHDYPHPRSIKGIEILAQKRGLETGLLAAESFSLIRHIQS